MRKLLPLAFVAAMMSGCLTYPYQGTSFEASPRIPTKVDIPDEGKVAEPGPNERGSKPETEPEAPAEGEGSTESPVPVVPSGEIGQTPIVFPNTAQPTGQAPVSNKMTDGKVGD